MNEQLIEETEVVSEKEQRRQDSIARITALFCDTRTERRTLQELFMNPGIIVMSGRALQKI